MKTRTSKTILGLAIASVLGVHQRAHAIFGFGDIVFDPALEAATFAQTAMEAAKFVEMINHQVSQITALTDQLKEMRHYVDLFGDPKAVVLSMATPIVDDLKKSEVGQTLGDLAKTVDGAAAFTYDANGVFVAIGAKFKTPGGVEVKREPQSFLRVAAIDRATDNFAAVVDDTETRRVELKKQVATTMEAIRAARTDAEVQKLNGVLNGLNAALAGTSQEQNQALATAVVQDIANRNDEQRQAEAQKEQQRAEFTEAAEKFGKKFTLLQAPMKFPSP